MSVAMGKCFPTPHRFEGNVEQKIKKEKKF